MCVARPTRSRELRLRRSAWGEKTHPPSFPQATKLFLSFPLSSSPTIPPNCYARLLLPFLSLLNYITSRSPAASSVPTTRATLQDQRSRRPCFRCGWYVVFCVNLFKRRQRRTKARSTARGAVTDTFSKAARHAKINRPANNAVSINPIITNHH